MFLQNTLVLIVVFSFIADVSSKKPPECVNENSDCARNIDKCEFICIYGTSGILSKEVVRLEKSVRGIDGFDDGSGTLQHFSNVRTIYIEKGNYFLNEPLRFLLEGKKGNPIQFLPFIDENVVIIGPVDQYVMTSPGATPLNYYFFGSYGVDDSGRIKFVSRSVSGYGLGNGPAPPQNTFIPGFVDIRFRNVDITNEPATSGTFWMNMYSPIQPSRLYFYEGATILFEGVKFVNLDIKIFGLKYVNQPGDTESLTFTDCHYYKDTNAYVHLVNSIGAKWNIKRSFFEVPVTLVIHIALYGNDNNDVGSVFEVENNIFYVPSQVFYLNIYGIDEFKYYVRNNLMYSSGNSIGFHNRAKELHLTNNVFYESGHESRLMWSEEFEPRGCIDKRDCIFENNYHKGDPQVAFTDWSLPNDFLEVVTEAWDSGRSFKNLGGGLDISTSRNEMFSILSAQIGETILPLTGSPKTTPKDDIRKRKRVHTNCPLKVGPQSDCSCNVRKEGLLCEREKLLDGNFGQNNLYRVQSTSNLVHNNNEQRRLSPPEMGQTILSVCMNEYWGIYISQDHELFIWGENFEMSYIREVIGDGTSTSEPIKIEMHEEIIYESEWNPVDLPSISAGTPVWFHEFFDGVETVLAQSYPIKVACTESSLFVLTVDGSLYASGRNEHHEIDGDRKLTSFRKTKENVLDISASYHTVYVIYDETMLIDVPYCDDVDGVDSPLDSSCDTYDGSQIVTTYLIEAIGANYHGCLLSNYSGSSTFGEYQAISYDFVQQGIGVPPFNLASAPHSDYTVANPKPDFFDYTYIFDDPLYTYFDPVSVPVYPMMKPMQFGLWVTYKLEVSPSQFVQIHFYGGMDHPSTNEDEPVLVLVDFENSENSGLENADKIDFVDRIIDKSIESEGGCMYLISSGRIYVSGNPKCSTSGISSNPLHSSPQEIQDVKYGDYVPSVRKRILRFECGYACYIVQHDSVYVFGVVKNGIGIGAQCPDEKCVSVTLASSDHLETTKREVVKDVVPGLGNSVPRAVDFPEVEMDLLEEYDVLSFFSPSILNKFDDNVVFKFPPELVLAESGIVENVLSIKLRKPEVFMQQQSEIFWSEYDELNQKWVKRTTDLSVVHPYLSSNVSSRWRTWNVDLGVEMGGPFDYFEISSLWEIFRDLAGWNWVKDEYSYDQDGEKTYFDSYKNRMNFVERFYLGVEYGEIVMRTEEYVFDFEIRFPKTVLQSAITVTQDPFSEYWDAYIVDKSFDRETRKGTIEFSTVTRYPNFFVFPENAVAAWPYNHLPDGQSEYTEMSRLGEVTPNNPEYFKTDEDVFFINEVGLPESGPFDGTSRRSFSCDSKNCYQSWRLSFRIIDDYRVCRVPETTFPIHWISFCMISEMSDEYHDEGDTQGDHEDCVDPSREVTFNIKLSIDNLCGGELVETIDTTFWMYLYADWTYPEPPIDTDSTVFNVGDWLYFKAGVDSTKVTIENTIIDTITWEDNSGVIQHLYVFDESTDERTRTTIGSAVKLVIDEMTSPKEVGFHFKLHNQLLMLQPDQQKTFMLKCYISVTYKGNEEDVRPLAPEETSRREVISIGNALVSGKMDLTVEYVDSLRFEFVPYFGAMFAIVCVAISVGVMIVLGIGTLMFGYFRKRACAVKIDEGVIVEVKEN